MQKHLTSELEAATTSIQHEIRELQQNLARLEQMVSDSEDITADQYQYSVWTRGEAARKAAAIGSLLARMRALQEALFLAAREQERSG